MRSHHPLKSALALGCTLLTCATPSLASPSLYSESTATLSYHAVSGGGVDAITNTRSETVPAYDNSSALARVRGCVNKGPGEPPCEPLQGGGPNWWNSPATGLESSTGAQAQSDFGINKARLHTGKDGCSDSPDCGASLPLGDYVQHSATARSMYREEFKYDGAVPMEVTFEFLLHGSWSGNGGLSLALGNALDLNSEDFGFAPVLDGVVFQSCNALYECVDSYDPIRNTHIFALPGNVGDYSSGSLDQLISWTTWVMPPRLDGNGQLDHYWGFESILDVVGYTDGADVDAFNTVTLQRILIPQGQTLLSVSGTTYDVQVVGAPSTVPEPPVSLLLLGAGLAMGATRRHPAKA